MTDTNPSDNSTAASDDETPPGDAPAAVHRRLSDAGVRLNEAQSHLSAVRTQATRSDLDDEVALAEGQALVRSLEECRERLDDALLTDAEFEEEWETHSGLDRYPTEPGETVVLASPGE